MNMIYGSSNDAEMETVDEDEEDSVLDTYRFDVAPQKL